MRRPLLLAVLLLALPGAAAAAPSAPTTDQLLAPDAAPLPGTPSGQAGTYTLPGQAALRMWRSGGGSILVVENVSHSVFILRGRTVSSIEGGDTLTRTTYLSRRAAERRFEIPTGIDPSSFHPAGPHPAAAPYVLRYLRAPYGLGETTIVNDYGSDLRSFRAGYRGAVALGPRVHGLALRGAVTLRDHTRGIPGVPDSSSDSGLTEDVRYGTFVPHVGEVGPQVSLEAARQGTAFARGNESYIGPVPDLRVAGLAVTLLEGQTAVFRRRGMVVSVTAANWTPTRAEWRAMLRQLR